MMIGGVISRFTQDHGDACYKAGRRRARSAVVAQYTGGVNFHCSNHRDFSWLGIQYFRGQSVELELMSVR